MTALIGCSRRRWAGLLLTATLSACGGSTSSGTVKTYTMQGQVLSVAPERKETVVKHEAIPGFMDAMTMPYYVREPSVLEGLRPGDLITSTLIVEPGGAAYLKEIRKVGEAPIERRSSSTAASSGFELVREGDAAPNATFTDQEGRTRDFRSFQGSTVVLTFIYTKCPLPTFCPLMDRHFARIQDRLAGDPALAGIHLVSVSFDPLTDTPAVLKRHAGSLKADPARWSFLTGDRDDIDRFAARFGVSIVRDPGDATDITHNLRTAIVDKQGTVVKIYTGNDWTPEQLLADLATLARSS